MFDTATILMLIGTAGGIWCTGFLAGKASAFIRGLGMAVG